MTPQEAGLLARFAVESGHLTATDAKPKLLEPNRSLQLSMFDIDGLACEDIRQLGIGVAKQRPTFQRLYGWGEISAAAARKAGLKIEYDNDPPRHASIGRR